MSNFKTDVQLLADLQSLINEADKTANMAAFCPAVRA